MNKNKIVYSQTGVNYELMDPLKIMAQKEGKRTTYNLKPLGFKEIEESRGESAYVVEYKDFYFALVEECLGTKSLVADATKKITGRTYYDLLAQDTVACIVNDLITVGAKPVTVVAYWALGGPDWFKDQTRMKDLVRGWAKSCNMAGASWGGGETPTLSGIIEKKAIDLAGAAFGVIKPKKRLTLGDKLKPGDVIILFESKGIQSNGVSLARKIAQQLPKGYATKIFDGRIYGEALLVPAIIYAKLIENLFEKKVDIHYMANITGHGWRKIMRSRKDLTYRITKIPPIPPVLQFIQEQANLDDYEAYSTLNMGAGFAIFVSKKDAKKVLKISQKHKIKAYLGGLVEKGPKQVIIEPKNIVYKGASLRLRV